MKNKIISGIIACMTLTMAFGQIHTKDTSRDAKKNKLKAEAVKAPIKVKPGVLNTTKTIEVEDMTEWLCPTAVLRGDREFDGHGPRIKSEVTLRIGEDQTSLWADIYFWAQETVHDFSTTEGTWTRQVYQAPYGQKIVKIKSDKASRTDFISKPAGFQFLVPGKDVSHAMKSFFDGQLISQAVLAAHGLPIDPNMLTGRQVASLVSLYSQGNTVMQVPATDGTLVKYFHIVGDTGGPDISTDSNCNDDTRIVKLEFFPVELEFAPTGL